jgi:hypothetical protein
MAENETSKNTDEAVVVTRAVENLLRKLVRFLVGRISLIKLQELVRFIFVEEIENKLRIENPEKNTPLSHLALLSGLDTRTVTKIRNNPNYRKPFYKEPEFLKEFVPGASILHVWSSKQPYIDENTGEPLELKISGNPPSFESLYSDSIKSRGVTYKSLLDRLEKSGAILVDEQKDRVFLVKKSYLPTNSEDKLGAIEMGFAALGNLADTVIKNICAIESGGEKLYQRGTWTYRMPIHSRDNLRDEINAFLKSTDAEARKIISKYENKNSQSEHLTAGVSFFYFEEYSK